MPTPTTIPLLPDDADGIESYYGDAPLGVRANMIFTPDGAAAFRGRTKAISDPADQMLLGYLRSFSDVIVAGSATIAAEDYGPVRLAAAKRERREAAGLPPSPRLAVVTARGVLPPTLRIFSDPAQRPLIVTGSRGASEHPELAEVGQVVIAGEERVEPAAMIAAFADLGLRRVLCEGGPYLLSTLIEADLVDEICVTVSPYLAGSQPTTLQPASSRIAPVRLELRHVLQREGLLYLRYGRPR